MKKLSNRLSQIVSFIDDSDKVIDVGSDHFIIPIYLALNSKIKIIDGSDINSKSNLQSFNKIKEMNLENKINVITSKGLEKIDVEKYNTIIIAGLGGKKIANILEEKKLNHKLILHPTNNHYYLRKILQKLNYKIIDEKVVYEHKIYNIIIKAIFSNEKINYEENELYLGPILINNKNEDEIKNYFNAEKERWELRAKKSKKILDLKIANFFNI